MLTAADTPTQILIADDEVTLIRTSLHGYVDVVTAPASDVIAALRENGLLPTEPERLPGIKPTSVTVHIDQKQIEAIVEAQLTADSERLRRVLGSDGDDSGLAAL